MLVELGDFVDHRLQPILGSETAATLHRGAQAGAPPAWSRRWRRCACNTPTMPRCWRAAISAACRCGWRRTPSATLLEESVVSQEIFNDLDRRLGERRRRLGAPARPRRRARFPRR